MKDPKTLQEAIAQFADKDHAFEYAKHLRWPGGNVTCPRCGQAKHSFIKTRRLWFCYTCQKQFTVKVGTIVEDSALGLDKWMVAIWMICNCKNGVSSYELHRAIGVTQKTAWFMLHRIREAMKNNSIAKLGGPDGGEVESDETFVGARGVNMHKDKKAPLAAASRTGTARRHLSREDCRIGRCLTAICDRCAATLFRTSGAIHCRPLSSHTFIAALCSIPTKRLLTMDSQKNLRTRSSTIMERYVDGHVHTNGLENFWSLLKRTLKGTYVAVEPFHLDHYVDEQVFRYNNRATKDNPLNDADRFAS